MTGFDGQSLQESIRRWADGVPEDLLPPPEGSPRARILAAAAEHFANDGFTGSTTRAIADTAGVNQAMIHYYFQSKTRLYERVLEGLIISLFSSLAQSLPSRADSPADLLVELPERIVDVFASDPGRVRIFRREIGNGAPHIAAVVERLGAAGPRGFRNILLGYIEAAQRSGALVARPAAATLAFLLVHAYGTLLIEPILRILFPWEETSDGLTQTMRTQRDFVRGALAARPKEEETS